MECLDYVKIQKLNLKNFKTENVKDMSDMFNDCHSLTSIDLSSFVTSNVEKMKGMFRNCKKLQFLNLSSFNIEKETDKSEMFLSCDNLKQIITNKNNDKQIKEALNKSGIDTNNIKFLE